MNLKLIIQGFIVGVGKIIPGVSGSMLAMTLGIYDNLLESITCFFGNLRKNFKFLFNFGLGVLLAIIFFSNILAILLNNNYYCTMYMVLGLIIGSLIPFSKNIDIKSKNLIIIVGIIIIMFSLSGIKDVTIFNFKGTIFNYIFVIVLGFIDALSSIIPGISGTTIFMILGSYSFVLKVLANPFNIIGLFYGVGLFLGIIIVSYLMHYLLKNHKEKMNVIIFGFMISSLLILSLTLIEGFNILNLGIFGLSLIISFILNKN